MLEGRRYFIKRNGRDAKMKSESYEEFVEKFKPKKTTDDCYTPPEVYEIVKNWAVKEYGWEVRPIVRPFFPGGDYVNFDYPDNCVVIDNPPFSILSKIVTFYAERGIDYFLFAPALTVLGIRNAKSHICASVPVIYDNGANVRTSFVASQGATIRSAPTLYKALDALNYEKTLHHPKYIYPPQVMTSLRCGRYSKYGIDYRENNVYFLRQLECQKAQKKGIYGSGYIVPAQKVIDAEAECARRATKRAGLTECADFVWQLSEAEQRIANELGNAEN